MITSPPVPPEPPAGLRPRLRFVTSQATAPRPPLPPRALNRKRSQKAFASTESERRIGAATACAMRRRSIGAATAYASI